MKKFRNMSEQHREKGRFKPIIPHNVPNVPVVSPRRTNDSANVSLKEKLEIPKDAPSVETIAKKHGVSVEHIKKQLDMGIKVEAEHGKNPGSEREIALDHLNEKPDYYTKLKKYVEDVDFSAGGQLSTAAETYQTKPNKDPMKKYNQLKTEQMDDTQEKVEMVQSQLHFIKYACEEILEYIEMGGEVEEWYQVKVAKSFSEFESLHAFIEGESRRKGMKEDVEQIDELSTDLLHRYKEKAAADSANADKQGDIVRGNKRFSGVIRATNKQYAKFRKKGFSEETEQIDEVSSDLVKRAADAAYAKGKEKQSFRFVKKHYEKQKKESDAFGKKMAEEVEQLEEKNVPTSPEKWAQAKAQAKAKFDVYPSAYANGWAAKKYKEMGGGWKSVSEQVDTPPFEPTKTKQKVIAGKHGAGYSTARHLARQAMQKQAQSMKKPAKLKESRKAEIVKQIVKKKKEPEDKFEANPTLTSQVQKMDNAVT